MIENEDETPFECLSDEERTWLRVFQEHELNFVVVGGYAVRAHRHIRFAPDLDLVIDTRQTNLQRLEAALTLLVGQKQSAEVVEHFRTRPNARKYFDLAYIDLLSLVESFRFEDLAPTALEIHEGEFNLKVISKKQLIEIKERGLARDARHSEKADQDREDLAALKKLCQTG